MPDIMVVEQGRMIVTRSSGARTSEGFVLAVRYALNVPPSAPTARLPYSAPVALSF